MRSEKAAGVILDNRHSMQPDLAPRRCDTTHGAHERVDAGRKTFANVWPRITICIEPSNDARDMQSPQNMTKDHGGYDIAAAGVEKNDASKPGVRTPGLEKIHEGLRRLSLDHAVSHDDIGTMSAAFVRFKRRHMEAHRGTVTLGHGRRDPGPHESYHYGKHTEAKRTENGGR